MKHRYTGSKVAIFLNGEAPIVFPKSSSYEKIFATDGAYYYLNKSFISPNIISGDFDSINSRLIPTNITIIKTLDQNFTDFEKLLHIIYKKGFLNIDVWGASGKEQDHFLGNLSTALKYHKKLSLIFYDNYYNYFFAEKKNYLYNIKSKIISLFPFPCAKHVTTKGLKYPLHNEVLKINCRTGIRNIAIHEIVEIKFTSGALIIFVER